MNNKGETLVETLFALLILTFVILGFTDIINGSVALNKAVKDIRTSYSAVRNVAEGNWSIGIGHKSENPIYFNDENLKIYNDEGFYFYEYDKQ